MKLLFDHKTEVGVWVAARLKHVRSVESFGDYTHIGILDHENRLVGAVIYHGYRADYFDIQMSVASDGNKRWLSRSVLASLFAYPFDQLGVQRITTLVAKRNKACLILCRKLGFRYEGTMKKGFGKDDLVISGMLKKDWNKTVYASHERADMAAV